jgi:hypothetical protein
MSINHAFPVTRFSDFSSLYYFAADREGLLIDANDAFLAGVGLSRADVGNVDLSRMLTSEGYARVAGWLAAGDAPAGVHSLNVFVAPSEGMSLRCVAQFAEDQLVVIAENQADKTRFLTDELLLLNSDYADLTRQLARKTAELESANAQLRETLEQLNQSYWHLKKIQEVLPICMGCGQVKTADSEWSSIVNYLKQNDIFVSHGYCPACHDAAVRQWGL